MLRSCILHVLYIVKIKNYYFRITIMYKSDVISNQHDTCIDFVCYILNGVFFFSSEYMKGDILAFIHCLIISIILFLDLQHFL